MKIKEKDRKPIVIRKAVFKKSKGIKTNVAAVKEFLKAFNMHIV
jgi:hypothetical protein